MDTKTIKQNEKNYPDLKRLRQVVNDKTRLEKERRLSAYCYAGIAYLLYVRKNEEGIPYN